MPADDTRVYDLAIIGAGAGGLIAARFAVKIGARVLLVERDRIGGDCTWTGCVPSKSLIRAAKAAHEVRAAHGSAIRATVVRRRHGAVRDYVQRRVREIYEPTSPDALRREGIDVALGSSVVRRCSGAGRRRAAHPRAQLPDLHWCQADDAGYSGTAYVPYPHVSRHL